MENKDNRNDSENDDTGLYKSSLEAYQKKRRNSK